MRADPGTGGSAGAPGTQVALLGAAYLDAVLVC